MEIAKSSLFFKQVVCYKQSEVLLTDSNLTLNLTDSLTLNGCKKDGGRYCNLSFISKLLGNLNFAQLVAYFLTSKVRNWMTSFIEVGSLIYSQGSTQKALVAC